MDLVKSNYRAHINAMLRRHPRFEDYGAHDSNEKLLYHCMSDWTVLDPEDRYSRVLMQKVEPFVWSDDFETHAVHQTYTRQHPMEKKRVRKVECGLAFELRLDEKMEFIERE
jgi:hypothetical protein